MYSNVKGGHSWFKDLVSLIVLWKGNTIFFTQTQTDNSSLRFFSLKHLFCLLIKKRFAHQTEAFLQLYPKNAIIETLKTLHACINWQAIRLLLPSFTTALCVSLQFSNKRAAIDIAKTIQKDRVLPRVSGVSVTGECRHLFYYLLYVPVSAGEWMHLLENAGAYQRLSAFAEIFRSMLEINKSYDLCW